MKKLLLKSGLPAVTLAIFVALPTAALAATTPNLGMAASFAILSKSYTNTASGTTLNGDLGYTTGPAVAPTVSGTTYSPPSSKYSTAGIDQGSALSSLASQACTFTFSAGAVNLATDTTHGTVGIYAPGVYCTAASSAASIGAAGITLSGSGTFIFKVQGALTTVTGSVVRLSGGASACNVFWAPIAATTLAATTTFAGTDIDASGVTIGDTVTWSGQALAFGGAVSTVRDTITVGTCAATPTPSPSPTAAALPSVPPTGAASAPGGFPSTAIGLALLVSGALITSTVWVRRRRA